MTYQHDGIDLKSPAGTNVYACDSGYVTDFYRLTCPPGTDPGSTSPFQPGPSSEPLRGAKAAGKGAFRGDEGRKVG